MSIKIITDSTSYIPQEYIDKYDIKVISLNVVMDLDSRRELDIDNITFYDEMDKASEIPKSSQPIPEEMLNTMKEILDNGDSIVGIFLSSKMSGTYSNACMMKNILLQDYPNANIEIIDSTTNCMQMGFTVIEAARAASEGKSIEEVVERANYIINNSYYYCYCT